jgi:hypothetical protein
VFTPCVLCISTNWLFVRDENATCREGAKGGVASVIPSFFEIKPSRLCQGAQHSGRQAMSLEFAQVVAQLVQTIGAIGQLEGFEDDVMYLLCGPAADMSSAMQQHFEQADDAHVVDFDARIAHRADGDRQGNALEQREVNVNVEPLRLETGEAAGNHLER